MWTPRTCPAAPVRQALGHHLHQSLGVSDDPGPAVAPERVLLGDDVVCPAPSPAPRSARRRPPRDGSRCPGHPFVVDGNAGSPRMVLITTIASAKPTWASCGVPATTSPTAHTPSAARPLVAIGDDEAPLVDRDPGVAREQPLGAGPAPDGHDDHGALDLAPVVQRDDRPGAVGTRRARPGPAPRSAPRSRACGRTAGRR